ncbi:hypothetical protein JCM9279_005065 [Rhodotorula babjevae]
MSLSGSYDPFSTHSARKQRPHPSPPPRTPFLTTTLAPSTLDTPTLDTPTCDYFPSVYLSDDETAHGDLTVEWDLSVSEKSLNRKARASTSRVRLPVASPSSHRSRSLAVEPSPLEPLAPRPLPPSTMRSSTVVSCLGRIEDGLCGACGSWVVAAVTWTMPGGWCELWEPDWSRWYEHAHDCGTGPPSSPLADLLPPSRSSSPSRSSPAPYKPLFSPPFDAPPSLITHMPPLLFLSPPYPDWSALVQPQFLPAPLVPEPAPLPPETLALARSVIDSDEPPRLAATATHSALHARVLEWRSSSVSAEPDEPAPLRDSTTEALAAVWGAVEADKENAPPLPPVCASPGGGGAGTAGKTPKYGLRTRTKRRATEFSHDELVLGAALPHLPALPAAAAATPAPEKKRRTGRA